MRVINLKNIPRICLLCLLMTLTFATPNILMMSDASFVIAQNRGQWDLGDRYYDQGFQAGRQDARRGLSNNYWRYRREFTDQWEAEFRQGYQDGYQNRYGRGYGDRDYDSRNRRYGQRAYGYGYGPSNDNLTGSMIWRGRVDHYVELLIRGRRVEVRERQGAPTINEGVNFTSPLPRAEVQVFVRKTAGRGDVNLLQSPSRSNGYTAVVAINDEKGGADNYEIELSWR